MNFPLTNRHDIILFFEVTNGNPNGDPDAGNMPRIEPNSNRGLVTDVCLKRKIRNYICEFPPTAEREDADNGFNILIKQGAVIETEQKRAIKAVSETLPKNAADSVKAEAAGKWLCREFYDVRTFGCVLSTGNDVFRGSPFGQLRGPVQITFGQSFHPITPIEITISVCAARSEGTPIEAQTGIQGHKHIVPYALYAAKCYVSPAFAEKTGFTNADLDLLFAALNNLFTHDHSAARGDMIVRGIYDFEHIGTQHENNDAQNKREARLGCAHAHVLFEGIEVRLKKNADGTDKEAPQSFVDYEIINQWDPNDLAKGKKDSDGNEYFQNLTLPRGVKLNLRHENPVRVIPPAR